MNRGVHVALAALALSGCAPARVPWRAPDPRTWEALRQELASLRAARPRAAWSVGVRVTTRSRGGAVDEARGGVAAAPGRAARLILLGGPGAALLDAWATPTRFRVEVPARRVVVRGGLDSPEGLPLGVLRWWLLAPLDGQLFAASETPTGPAWLLRDRAGGAVLELRHGRALHGELAAVRRSPGHAERVVERRAGPELAPGDTVDYEDLVTGLEVHLLVESVASGPPPDEAFADPDGPGGGS